MNRDQILVFDIETIIDQETNQIKLFQELKDKQDKSKGLGGKLVDPVKIDAKARETLEKIPLDIKRNQILCISYAYFAKDENGKEVKIADVIFSLNEKKVIEKFYEFMQWFYQNRGGLTLGGFNIREFDLPCLRVKLSKHKIENKTGFSIMPKKKYDCLDARDLLQNKGTLEEYLESMRLQGKYKNMSGKEVASLFLEGKYEEIKKYSLVDAIVELEIVDELVKY